MGEQCSPSLLGTLKKETGDSYTGDRRKITYGFAPPSNFEHPR
ncbi:hypothetical protein [Okeania sp. SIO2C2]|nr:hypothetical protein [Okeania sp. SIO2C2]